MSISTATANLRTPVVFAPAPVAAAEKFSDRRLPQLDALRGLAILMVVSYHYYLEAVAFDVVPKSAVDYLHRVLALGWSGVDLFFVLSGFLLGGILLDHRTEAGYFKPFYVRRACRILPAYLLVLVPFAIVIVGRVAWANPLVGDLFKGALPLWNYFTFTQNFHFEDWGPVWMSVTWSLCIEEQFYLLLPFLVRYTAPRQLPGLLGLLMMIGIVFRMAALYSAPLGGMAAHTLLPCRWDCLFLGVIGAWLVRRWNFIERCRRHWRVGVMLFAILGAGLLVYAYARQGVGMSTMVFGGYTWLGAFYFCGLMMAVVMPAGRKMRLLCNPLLRGLGACSYGLYLIHLPALFLTHALVLNQKPQIANGRDAAVTVLAFGISLALATVSYHAFEKHFLRLGRRWKYADAENSTPRRTPEAPGGVAAPEKP
jgi:peptidoglycan/LPS O-acetylase OafA/YrhL